MPLSWSCHLNPTLIPIRYIYLPTLLHPVYLFTTPSIIPNSTVLCANKSQYVSHKTLKVYLCGIHLWHIEEGFSDPTNDPLLQLVCRGIHCMQGDGCRTRLPITTNILHTLKCELRQSHYSLAEKRMLLSAFTLAFYGFLCASEYLNLKWSDITHTDKITIKPHQSKTDPFCKGHQVLIFPTNTSTCPLRAFLLYVCSSSQ